jgi:hypothetical protein
MIIDGNISHINKEINSDITIVGAGMTGLFLAYLIKDKFNKIIIIEKGNEISKIDINQKQKILSKNMKHQGVLKGISQGIGGTTKLWGGQLVEFLKDDIKKDGINYRELKNLYEEVYNFFNHKIKKNVKQPKYTKKIKFIYTSFLQEKNFFVLFKDFINSEKVIIYKNLNVYDICCKNKILKEIYALNKKNKNYTFSSKIFIFSSGTLDTVRLFLNVKDKINSRGKKFIGKYFHDHIGAVIGQITKTNTNFNSYFESFFSNKIKHKPKLVLIKKNLINISCEVINRTQYDRYFNTLKKIYLKKEYLNLFIKSIYYTFKTKFALIFLFYSLIFKKKIKIFNKEKNFAYIQIENLITKKSQIQLVNTKKLKDKLYPVVLNWHFSGDEIQDIIDYIKEIESFLMENNLGKLIVKKKYMKSSKNYLHNFNDTNHQSGGMIMSKTPKTGVIDINQKMWDIKNLYINGSCIFNNSSFANIGLTSLAYTLRLSKHLR